MKSYLIISVIYILCLTADYLVFSQIEHTYQAFTWSRTSKVISDIIFVIVSLSYLITIIITNLKKYKL